jgi:hypothetical protein
LAQFGVISDNRLRQRGGFKMRSSNLISARLMLPAIIAIFLMIMVVPASGQGRAMSGGESPFFTQFDATNPPFGADEAGELARLAVNSMDSGKYMDSMHYLCLASYVLEEGMDMHSPAMGMYPMGVMMGGMMGCTPPMTSPATPVPMPPMGSPDMPTMNMPDSMSGTGGQPYPGMSEMREATPMGAEQAMSLAQSAIDAMDAGQFDNALHGLHAAIYILQAGAGMSMMSGMGGMMGGMGNMPSMPPAPPSSIEPAPRM